MPLVYLIRHGQASFGADDYDVLSATGHLQGKHVGAELRRRGVKPDQVWSGTLRRQRETALAAALDVPLQEDPRWNEFDHLGLVLESGQPATPREFQQALDKALRGWTGTDGWRKFSEEVNLALTDLLENLEGTAVVFTSGGVISAVCTRIWGLDGEGFVTINRVAVNGAMTKLVHGRSGTSLVSYNDHAHFEGEHRELLTYR